MPFLRFLILGLFLGFADLAAAQWLPVGGDANDQVAALSVYQNQLVAAGDFTTLDSTTVNRIAAWNGTSWQPLGSGLNQFVAALAPFNGDLIAAGVFTAAGSVSAKHIARWDGSTWSPLSSGTNGIVHALAEYNGQLIAGGEFTSAGGSPAKHVARWDGTAFQALGSGLDSSAEAFAVYNNELIAAGRFMAASGTPASRIARWDGSTWQPLGSGLNGPVHAVQVYQNELYATGDFTMSGAVPANHVARWNGSTWSPLGNGLNQTGYSFTIFNQTLIVGGAFTTAGSVSASHIARWDGGRWFPFGSGFDSEVTALGKWDDQLFAGGDFSGNTGAGISSWQLPHKGPVKPIGEGYGANGNYTVQLDSFPNPLIPTQQVYVFRPAEATGLVPTLFFATAQNSSRFKRYDALIEHIVSTGHALVFPTRKDSLTDIYYDTALRYETMWSGFTSAVKLYPNLIDTTRVGFMGHSFGGGAVPAMAKRGLQDRGWGANGNFIYRMAPWYALQITQAELQSFPANTKLLEQVFDIDKVVSERLAIDIFEHINIPDSEKDFLTVRSDTIAGYWLAADHKVPYTFGPTTENDGLDFYGIYRKYDALSRYAFTGDTIAKKIALGNGDLLQTFMGKAPDSTDINRITVSDNPTDLRADSLYTYRCDVPFNPRQQYCFQVTAVPVENPVSGVDVTLFPNPAGDQVQIGLIGMPEGATVSLMNSFGQFIRQQLSASGMEDLQFSLKGIKSGLYLIEVKDAKQVIRKKLLVQ